jgi:hypothetical protein
MSVNPGDKVIVTEKESSFYNKEFVVVEVNNGIVIVKLDEDVMGFNEMPFQLSELRKVR